MTASIGITSFPEHASEPELLIKYADTAMYQAKQKGRDTYCTFTPQMNVELLKQLSLEAALRKAIDNEQFVLHYQPKVNMVTGRITGMEALLRWQRPGHGLVLPLYFISVLEDSGLIVQVGNWVIATVCAQIKQWSQLGHRAAPGRGQRLGPPVRRPRPRRRCQRRPPRERHRPLAPRARTDRELA